MIIHFFIVLVKYKIGDAHHQCEYGFRTCSKDICLLSGGYYHSPPPFVPWYGTLNNTAPPSLLGGDSPLHLNRYTPYCLTTILCTLTYTHTCAHTCFTISVPTCRDVSHVLRCIHARRIVLSEQYFEFLSSCRYDAGHIKGSYPAVPMWCTHRGCTTASSQFNIQALTTHTHSSSTMILSSHWTPCISISTTTEEHYDNESTDLYIDKENKSNMLVGTMHTGWYTYHCSMFDSA